MSLISRDFLANVIYYDSSDKDDLKKRIVYPLTLYKFLYQKLSGRYYHHLKYAYKDRNYTRNSYDEFIQKYKSEFCQAITLISIIIVGRPTFSELVGASGLSPKDVSDSLHKLFQSSKVQKINQGRYIAVLGYRDALLEHFSTTEISKARSMRLANA